MKKKKQWKKRRVGKQRQKKKKQKRRKERGEWYGTGIIEVAEEQGASPPSFLKFFKTDEEKGEDHENKNDNDNINRRKCRTVDGPTFLKKSPSNQQTKTMGL